jgi:hypothetical protein
MNNVVGLDRAVEYVTKIEKFRALLESQDTGCIQNGDTVKIEKGRKFDKVYIQTKVQKLGRYMVDRNSWVIYGIKSWAQINERRTYGTLDLIDQYDWSQYYGAPKAGTEAEKLHTAREEEISKQFKPRGRPRKT